jgi:hypothetical protein
MVSLKNSPTHQKGAFKNFTLSFSLSPPQKKRKSQKKIKITK